MSVIGRLDEQVDAILISPRKRKDEVEATTTETPKRAEMADEQPRRHEAHDVMVARRAAKIELPVWLL